jgi:mgtE-like transporter
MGITVVVAQLGVRHNWDLDNVTAPIVTAAGDMVTLPALFLATYLVGIPWLTAIVGVICAVAALIALVASLRSRFPILRRIARESLPVLVLAGTIDVVAGLTIEKRFQSFLVYPALLVLVPPFLEDSGALGSILSARVSTKLHLGTLVPGRGSLRSIGEDFLLVYLYAVPVFLLLGVSADIAALVAGLKSPGSLEMIAVSMLAGVIATTFAVLVGFYGAVAAYRLGLDPDNHGIPIVTSSLDLLGAFALILVIVALGLT